VKTGFTRLTSFLTFIMLLFILSCSTDNDNSQDTEYDFYSYTEFNQWYQDHTWAVRVDILSGSAREGIMVIEPWLDCFLPGTVSTSDEFRLQVNEEQIPLIFNQGNVVVDYSGPDIYIDYATVLHIIFSINGADIINKSVKVPVPLTLSPPANLVFSNPVTLNWSLQKDPDYQEAEYQIRFWTGLSYIYRTFNKLLRPADRVYTLPTDDILDAFNISNPAYLQFLYATIKAMNFEEQGDNVIAVRVISSVTAKK
jgi:hypothetical protein